MPKMGLGLRRTNGRPMADNSALWRNGSNLYDIRPQLLPGLKNNDGSLFAPGGIFLIFFPTVFITLSIGWNCGRHGNHG